MKRTGLFCYSVLFVILAVELVILAGCKKVKVRIESVTTTEVTNITYTTASSGGNITDDGGHLITSRGVCWSTSSGPTIADSKTTDSSGTGSFTSSITGLEASTAYYLRAYGTNSEGTVYGDEVSFSTLQLGANQVQDIDGNIYNTITIGTQVWMKENLKTTRYSNGTAIPNVTDPTAWENLGTTGAYCDYDNDPANSSIFGRLYNYYVCERVSDNVCPTGWHVPSDNAWGTLAIYLGGTTIAGGKLKETGTDHWSGPNTGATNETGFTAIPGGARRKSSGLFSDKGGVLYLWEIQFSQSVYFNQSLSFNSSGLYRNAVATNVTVLGNGYSIRCMKNDEIPVLNTAVVTNITSTSATSGGSIISGGTIYAKGVCWSTSNLPTLNDKKTNDGTGPGPFVSNITDLIGSTTYYVRAYAQGINYSSTGYGPVVSFTSNDTEVPVLTTTAITSITPGTASSGGNVISNGGSPVTSRGVCWSTSSNPTASDSKTSDGTGSGSFISNLTGLTPNTIYYLKAYATNSVGTGYGNQIQFNTNDYTGQTGTVKDFDGNTYKTIGIGNQIWMAENLRSTKYNDGTAISNVTDPTAWSSLGTTGAYCWYNNDSASYKNVYGALYNWYAVNTGKLCPVGWHVAADAEWTVLITFLGGESIAGGKLKESGTTHWLSPNLGATNESGFTAMPGGLRYKFGGAVFLSMGSWVNFWTATDQISTEAIRRALVNTTKEVYRDDHSSKMDGYSVRCLKDN
ncbi:MAG: fibrobacter succinogenes major paralogous domain-containing protein [Bacteroidia bacterium]|nr:fibrobacter succinogenes major paralogous domain-containing protein [Bacteroidia bacterium]